MPRSFSATMPSSSRKLDPPPSRQAITWAPIAAASDLSFLGTSYEDVRKSLHKAFGSFPVRLSFHEDANVLRGMIAAAGEGAQAYETLYKALEKFGELEINDV
jgi:hypothetical protein